MIATLALATQVVYAKVVLPALLSDNAVLQQQSDVKLWGTATGSEVTITPSWDNKEYTAKVNPDGSWECKVTTPSYGEGYSIVFNDGESTTINNLLIGEVWFASGQSNMVVPMKGNVSQLVEGATDVILEAKASTPIRLFSVAKRHSFEPVDECEGEWKLYTPDNVASFGATPLFFARYLQSILEMPVGVVNCSWGSSTIESWMERSILEKDKECDLTAIDKRELEPLPQKQPTLLYNGMLLSMRNLCFKGMIWYQGESNCNNAESYPKLFSQFASMLRSLFDCGEFPIYYAQIAPFGGNTAGGGTAMRIAQSKIMERVSNTGMVVLSDAGESTCIHPRFKEIAGKRFAYWALGNTYGYTAIEYRAPELAEVKQVEASGKLPKHVALRFNHAKMGLSLHSDRLSENFEVAGSDGIYYPAQMRLVFKSEYPILLWSDQVEDIKSVRYGFKDYFKGDVFNNFGIPLSSFCAEL